MPAYRDPFGDDSPGPYLTLSVSWKALRLEILALLDTGADMTQIPISVAPALRLEQIDEVATSSAHGDVKNAPVFAADLEFDGLRFRAVPVVADEFPIALIGRDLLNELDVVMQGPARQFTIERPAVARS